MEKKGRNVKARTKMKGKKMERKNGRTVRKKGKERRDKKDSKTGKERKGGREKMNQRGKDWKAMGKGQEGEGKKER